METPVVILGVVSVMLMVARGQGPEMVTTSGKVEGTLEDGVKKFMGIPYAKPPTGQLRFKPPTNPDPWTGVRKSTKLPNSCWQILDDAFDRFHGVDMWNPNTPMSEDCLYLNVWIPDTATAQKPILVWIYGGGFWAGTSTLDVYNPTKLASMMDVIVVSMNYRLGPLGFLYSGESDVPGNVGILDQVMAMQWVNDNAVNMGGHPSKITIMGESAGAASVGYHLLSPLSKDLFTYAIMMSASPLVHWGVQSQHEALSRFKKLAGLVGCDEPSYILMTKCMRLVNASTIIDQQWGVADGSYFDPPFALIVGDDFMPEHPFKLLKDKKAKKTSVIAGMVKDEGIYWLIYGFTEVFKLRDPNPVSNTQYQEVLDGLMDQTKQTSGAVENMTSFVYRDFYPSYNRPINLDVLDDISGDTLFKCAVRDFASEYSTYSESRTSVYSFNYRLSNNPWPAYMGVAHGYEIEAFMGLPFLNRDNYTDADRGVSMATMKYISNFMRTGDPNSGNQAVTTSWPVFTNSEQKYLVMEDSGPSTSQGLRYKECFFWENAVPELDALQTAADRSQSTASISGPVIALQAFLCFALVWAGSVLLLC